MIERIDQEPLRTERQDSTDYVVALLRCYPSFKAHDAKGYTVALCELFEAYPRSLVSRVVDVNKGLPGKLTFPPTIADVRKALEAEMNRRALIRANALWHIKEAERRREARAKQAVFEQRRPPAEERQRQVQDALARFRDSLVDKAKSVW